VVQHRWVIDAQPRAIIVTDPRGTILLWSEAASSMYGWSEDEVLGRSVLDVLAPPDELASNQERFDAARSGDHLRGDRTVRRRDGRLIRVATITKPISDAEGTIVAIVGTAEEVTEQRAAEQAARDLGEHFRIALEAGGLGTWHWNMTTGVTTWDDRLHELFGLEPGTFDGTFATYADLIHPHDRDAVLASVGDAVESRSTYRVDHRVVWPDGTTHWITGAGGVVLDERGDVTGTIGCCMDITERMEQQAERDRLAIAAVDNAARERVLRERLEFLSAIHDALTSSPDRHELMENVTAAAVPRLGDWCAIHVLPTDADAVRPLTAAPDVVVAHIDPAMVEYAEELREQFPYDPHAPSGIAHVIRTRTTEFHPRITTEVMDALEASDEVRRIVEQLALRSSITVPLAKGAHVFGAMQFVMSSSSRTYTESDVVLAEAVAGRIASSLEVRRLNDLQRSIADTLQRSLLPTSMPEVPGVDVAVRYWANGEASSVGGDFFDLFAAEPGSWAVVIGDVCGTGPAAAALTGLARHTVRDATWHGDEPGEVLRSLNRSILRAETDSFCTAIYGLLEPHHDTVGLRIVCGGHPLPILVDSTGARSLGGPGTLLGVFEDTRFAEESLTLCPGDVVVFFTDGATDVPPPHALTDGQFRSLVERSVREADDVESIADRIRHNLEAILSFDHRADDVALLVLAVGR